MNAKNKFCYKYILAALVLSFAIQCVSSDDENDGDDAAVEVQETDTVIEIPYSSPTPSGNYYLAENFDDVDKFKRKWIVSQAKKEGIDEELAKYDGVWEVEEPQRDGLKLDLGLVLKSKAKHAAIAAKLDKPYHFIDKPLVVQYEVNFQEGQECGGAYLKLLSQSKENTDLKQFFDKTPYTIMFGPDKCGNDLKLHFIFRHRNPKNGTYEEKHCKKPKDRLNEPFEDKRPHLYTLIVNPDNTFEIRLDHKVVNQGSLLEDFTPPVNPEAEIDDPDDVKPSNWDEREKIPDPDAKKPDDWDENAPAKIVDKLARKPEDWLEDEPLMIPDPDAEKPEDWDTDMDGEWEAPLVENPACESVSGCGPWEPPHIDNPAYKGKWVPPLIDNPNYQGKWKPRRIPNPYYFVDDTPYKMTPISAIGFELWSMSPSIFFDNILITDSVAVAEDFSSKSFDLKKRKIDQDSVSFYGRIMRAINYKPGWWALYAFYISIPLVAYWSYLYKRLKEVISIAESGKSEPFIQSGNPDLSDESILTRVLKYSNERPYLYAVYIVAIGLPIALLFVFCCSDGKKESSDSRKEADAKKTDAYTPDDVPVPAKSRSQLDIPEDNEDEGGDDNAEDDEAGDVEDDEEEDDADDGDISQEEDEPQKNESGQGDVPSSPRKRKPLKE